ncbi:helix-turn-helix domain-containing protein [Ruania albidiflava]|uniref:helix-turn-helix domain-containing protein n=1 Tax=Ruania albidiflava TaxID=366586 RepID=UPI0003B70AE4|nr:helix-turn-helix transcriptional regulator [Ruania albidiflava]
MRTRRLHAVPVPAAPAAEPGQETTADEPLWRHLLGARLRRLRTDRGQTLTETAERAGISPQYLSEIERGVKEPSSEMIAAVAGALGVTLLDLTVAVARELSGLRTTAERQLVRNVARVLSLAA